MGDDNQAVIRHNTYTIISANAAALALFRCESWQIIDQDMLWLICDPDFVGLAKMRLNSIRRRDLNSQNLPLWRFDGTQFEATVQTRRISGKEFESTLVYLHEIER